MEPVLWFCPSCSTHSGAGYVVKRLILLLLATVLLATRANTQVTPPGMATPVLPPVAAAQMPA